MALLLGAGVAALAVLAAPMASRPPLALLGAAAVALVGAGCAGRWMGVVGAAAVVLGATVVLADVDAGTPALAVAAGPGILAVVELAHWSIDLATPVHDRPRVHLGRWAWIVAVVAGSAGLGAVLFVVSGVPVRGGLPLDAVAVAAAVALVALAAALAQRGRAARSLGAAGPTR